MEGMGGLYRYRLVHLLRHRGCRPVSWKIWVRPIPLQFPPTLSPMTRMENRVKILQLSGRVFRNKRCFAKRYHLVLLEKLGVKSPVHRAQGIYFRDLYGVLIYLPTSLV